MSRWLPKPEVPAAMFDIFSIKQNADCVDFLMRVPQKMQDKVLEKAGTDGIFPRPRGEGLRAYGVHWFQGPNVTLDYARTMFQEHSAVSVGIAHKDGQYGLRTTVSKMDELRQALGASVKPNYIIKGVPIEASQEFVESLIAQLKWPAVFVKDPKRVRRGMSEWLVKATKPPENEVYQVQADTYFLHVEILSLTKVTSGKTPVGRPRKGPSTWSAAARPGIFTAGAESESDESTMTPWDDSEAEAEEEKDAEMASSEAQEDNPHGCSAPSNAPTDTPHSGRQVPSSRAKPYPAPPPKRQKPPAHKRSVEESSLADSDAQQVAISDLQIQMATVQAAVQELTQQLSQIANLMAAHTPERGCDSSH